VLGRLSVRHLFVMVPIVGIVAASGRALTDNSFLWHVRAGTVQLDAGEVLRADPFSFTAGGEAWRTQSWIADLGYGVLERATDGLAWVWPMIALTMLATAVLIAVAVYRDCPNPLATAVVLFFLVWLLLRTLVPRPVIFSHLLLAALIVALGHPRVRWAIPLLVWVWAGVHGSFVIGIGLVVLEALRSQRRELWRTAALSAVAASFTAHGLALWGVLGAFAANRGALDLISEWASPDFTDTTVAPYALFVVAVLVAAARGKISSRDLIVVVPFALFGLTSYRALIPAALVLAPWVGRAIEVPTTGTRQESGVLNGALAVGLIVVAVLAGAVRAESTPDPDRFPVAAVEAVAEGNLFHDDSAGGYLIYREWPDRLVYIDDRAELYGTDRAREFARTRAGQSGWLDTFARHDIHQALLEADATGLQEVLGASGWVEAYRDDSFVVLVDQ